MNRLLALLVLALLLRLALIAQGGQLYLPDEGRVTSAQALIGVNTTDDLPTRLRTALSMGHSGYMLFAVPSVWLGEQLGDDHQTSEKVAAGVLALCSVACIALVYALARRGGADEDEALLAALFMTASSVMFYYARHFVPYDAALMLALAALWVSLRPAPAFGHLVLSGLLLSGTFFVYNGYWMLIFSLGVLLVLYQLRGRDIQRLKEMLRRVVGMAAGAALIVLGMSMLSLAGGVPFGDIVRGFIAFAGSVT